MTTDSLVAQGTGLRKLHLDEMVEWMWERDEHLPGRGQYRMQHIQLVRDGQMRHFIGEIAPTIAHPTWKEFNFPALGCYSVGESLEIAEMLRENTDPEQYEPINLALSYLKEIEERQKRRVHQSVFGSGFVKVR